MNSLVPGDAREIEQLFHRAAECERRAYTLTDDALKKQYLELARQWRDMAHQWKALS